MKLLWALVAAWFAPRLVLRRYRVMSQANPAAFRHDLLRGIQFKLRRAGLAASRRIPDHSTL